MAKSTYLFVEYCEREEVAPCLLIHDAGTLLELLLRKRDSVIKSRTSKPIFNEFDPNDKEDVARYRKLQEKNLRIVKMVV